MDLFVSALIPFLIAIVAPLALRVTRRAALWLALGPAALTIYFLAQIDAVRDGEGVLVSYEWIPALGIDFALRLDGLSLLFASVICGVGTLIVIYSHSYLAGHENLGRFYALLFLFMGSMLGLVLADDLITLFVFWELTSISSYGLIAFESQRETARAAASQALFVTGSGGLFLLAGFVLIGVEAGTFSISELSSAGSIAGFGLYEPILALVLLGAFTKSAQVPFHFWLPNAMEAPTPVSAYLHSATMVKAGVYLIARTTPVLGGTDAWLYTLFVAGGLTMLLGAFYALRENDLKRILAYSTLSVLGSLVLLIGIGTEEAILAAVVLLLAHVMYKAALFLAAGIIDHETGTRDIRRLGGLASAMPVTAACVVVAAAGMAGLPPLLGFIAKESIYEAVQHGPHVESVALVIAVAANVLLVAVAIVPVAKPFWGERPQGLHIHEADRFLLAGPVVFAALLVAAIALPVDTYFAGPAAGSILLQPVDASFKLWHGFNLALVLSVVTFLMGVAMYGLRPYLAERRAEVRLREALGPEALYDKGLALANQLAVWQTRVLQSGYLRAYLTTILAFALLMVVGTAIAREADIAIPEAVLNPTVPELAVVLITALGVLLTATTGSRLTAIISVGVVGYGVALTYALFSAPDLAMTQILVETLIVLLMVFAFYRLPRFASYSRPAARARDAALAAAAGATVTVLLLASIAASNDRHISERLVQASKPEAHGSNVVNVILVDFRSLDTLGEITVLAVAGVGFLSLLGHAVRRRTERS